MQKLLGHKDVKTTEICTHLLNLERERLGARRIVFEGARRPITP